MKAAAFQDYVIRRLDRIAARPDSDRRESIRAYRLLLERIFELATEDDRLHFATMPARIAYVAHRHAFSRRLIGQLFRFRRQRLANLSAEQLANVIITGQKVILACCQAIFEQALPLEWDRLSHQPYPTVIREPEVVSSHENLRVVALEIDLEREELMVREEARPTDVWHISFANEESSERIRQAAKIIRLVTGLPVLLNLISVEVYQNRRLAPRQIVIDPDYLIDVTAAASAFGGGDETQPWASLSRRLLPYEQRLPLLMGNIVNLFLDVLVNEPDTPFPELSRMIFQTQPLALCCLTDAEVKQLIEKLRGHYVTLRKVVKEELTEQGIKREESQLEPSFYNPNYGLQGRLDLLHRSTDAEGNTRSSIVELKSGKIFRPNKHGLNQSHFVQTLLYDLMINQAFGVGANVASYILYSQSYEQPLRYAPPEYYTQLDALTVRNQLLAIEVMIAKLGVHPRADLLQETDGLIGKLDPRNFGKLSPFVDKDFRRVLEVYRQLDELERRYFGAFFGFTAREHRLAKTGEQGSEKLNGLASLWLDEPKDKIGSFELLTDLRTTTYDPQNGTLTFERTPTSEERMVKFRSGDIVVLYPTAAPQPARGELLDGPIFKSTLIRIGARRVVLRLRSRQLSDRFFRRYLHWAIEKDVLDSSFSNHYRGLFAWASAPDDQRRVLLGRQAPRRPSKVVPFNVPALTEEQNRITTKLIAAPDYFLLWGPPGTGKTSMMLHHAVAHLLQNTEENILIVAYTNRAVDEICESIEHIGGGFRDYIRIGSRFGAAERYQDRLLSLRSEAFSTRAELLDMLDRTRVFVGTVASVGGKEELFKLKRFDRVIVDEASQILEPLLLGLLARIPRAVLIGDHRQLPAVVQQSALERRVRDAELRQHGVTDLSVSLFERLYRRAKQNDWNWCYDQLSHQGRMHQRIMAFPASRFYQNRLDILPEKLPQRERQLAPLPLPVGDAKGYDLRRRVIFHPTPIDAGGPDPKTNRHEAEAVVGLIQDLELVYRSSKLPLAAGDVGIITPYRAQIATLRHHLRTAGLDPDVYTVDTVERYQGGARRIIIISLCTNDERQMISLAKTDEENIDRKLNVAMTRAREQLILVGCPDILRTVDHYADLLDFIADQTA